MPGQQSDDFTKDFIEAGLRITQMEIMRSRFILGSGAPLSADSYTSLKARDYFLAEILADPDKAALLSYLFTQLAPIDNSNENSVRSKNIWPLHEMPLQPDAHNTTQNLLTYDAQLTALHHFQALSAALISGAALAGAAKLDPRFLYSHSLDGRIIKRADCSQFHCDNTSVSLPLKADNVLLMGFVRSPQIVGLTPGMAKVKPKCGYLGIEDQIQSVLNICQGLWDAGFIAVPSAGGLIMADQHAALAGMGELGRQGLLICPEYGPNIRLFSIITDYPLEASSRPLDYGVAAYCNTCQRCINECPAKAISDGQCRLTALGLWQWPVNYEACFKNWLEKKDPCQKCIEVCPYTREPLSGSSGGRPNP